MVTGKFNPGGSPAVDLHPIQGGVEILLVASSYSYRNWDQILWPKGLLDSYADFYNVW